MQESASVQWWLGVDVAKVKLDVALLGEGEKIKFHVFSNNPKGFDALVAWLVQHGCSGRATHVCLEATGPYGEALATALSDGGWIVSVVNPARVKGFAQSQMARNKTDRADAALLAHFVLAMHPAAWQPPTVEVRELQALVERLETLKGIHQQESNRLEAAMNAADMQRSIEGHLAWLKTEIAQLEQKIDDHIDRHPNLRSDAHLITSIPGMGDTTAAKLLAYLGDVRRFRNARALAAFIGVTPRIKQSGSSVHGSSIISRAGHAQVRHSLYMPAMVALRYNPAIKAFGERLKAQGMPPKAVIAAAMHKLVRIVFGVLRSRTAFSADYVLDFQGGI